MIRFLINQESVELDDIKAEKKAVPQETAVLVQLFLPSPMQIFLRFTTKLSTAVSPL